MKTKVFHYTVVQTLPISELNQFADHRRLSVFHQKGCKCIRCGLEATQIILGEKKGQLHWDLYDDNMFPLTVDHIIPRSRGGSDEMYNLQPMCADCNRKKGNSMPHDVYYEWKIYQSLGHFCKWPRVKTVHLDGCIKTRPVIGQEVFRKSGKKLRSVGIVNKFITNPWTNEEGFMVEGNDVSIYSCTNAYIQQQ